MFTYSDTAPDPVSYECQWSGEWSPVPGCAIEVDVDYQGSNLNSGGNARGADRQPSAHACQAFCRANYSAPYFKWVSPEGDFNPNHTRYNNRYPFSCYCKSEVIARVSTRGIISGAASDCGVDCASPNATSNCSDAGMYNCTKC